MRKAGAAALLAVIVAGAGCGGSSRTSSATTAPPSTETTVTPTTAGPNIKTLVLSLSDMPQGWSIDNSPSPTTQEPGCLAPVKSLFSQTVTHADIDYQGDSNGLPQVGEGLVRLSSAVSGYNRVVTALSTCKSFSVTDSGQHVDATVGQMAFQPPAGATISAYQVNLSSQGLTFGVDIFVFAKGNYAGELGYGDIGTPDLPVAAGFLTKALAKIPG